MKNRLDILLTQKGLCESPSKALSLIMSGIVYVNGKKAEKAGMAYPEDAQIEIRGKQLEWVSRGGLKLEEALNYSKIDVKNMIALDVGASTGGFTDVLLKNGAKKVYAVDVGYGQLAHSLRIDTRVVVLERTNARYLTHNEIPDKIDICVCDASFISLKKVLEKPLELVRYEGFLIALIKPQFEAERNEIGKKGVVKDDNVHQRICVDIKLWLENKNWQVLSVIPSPILGPEGNKEFLIIAKNLNENL